MKSFKLLILLSIVALFPACSEDDPGKNSDDGPVEPEVSFIPVTVSFETAGMIKRDAPKDSFIYNDNNEVENYYQFRVNGTIRKFHYLEEISGKIIVYRNLETESEYEINPPVGNSQITNLTKYERQTSTPGIIKYTTEGNVVVITRWEYPSLENPDFIMEVDGDIVKRTIVTLNESGNVSKIEVLTWDFTHGYLEKVLTIRDIVYGSYRNPLKGLRKEYEFSEPGFYFNHELIEFYSNNNVISYSVDYHDEVSGEVKGTNNLSFSYQVDSDQRIISSNASAGQGEYKSDILSIKYANN